MLPSNKQLAFQLIERIVDLVASWHTENPGSLSTNAESETAFAEILNLLGDFRRHLVSVRLEFDKETEEKQKDNDGTEFKSWAVTCDATPAYLRHMVRKTIKLLGKVE